jgi:hypothetical protein
VSDSVRQGALAGMTLSVCMSICLSVSCIYVFFFTCVKCLKWHFYVIIHSGISVCLCQFLDSCICLCLFIMITAFLYCIVHSLLFSNLLFATQYSQHNFIPISLPFHFLITSISPPLPPIQGSIDEKRVERKVTISGVNMVQIGRAIELINVRVLEWKRTYVPPTAQSVQAGNANIQTGKRDRNDVPVAAANRTGGAGVNGVDQTQAQRFQNYGQSVLQPGQLTYDNNQYAQVVQGQQIQGAVDGQGMVAGIGMGMGMGQIQGQGQGGVGQVQLTQAQMQAQQQYNQAYAAYAQAQVQAQAQGVGAMQGGGQGQVQGQGQGQYAQQYPTVAGMGGRGY